jgi:HNH endonuclease
MPRTPKDHRFWSKVAYIGATTEECWEWQGGINPGGYGNFHNRNAHRYAFEFEHGWLPDGPLDHFFCSNRRCVNPFHLVPATTRENVLRSESFVAINARKTHCPQGHPYDEVNTRLKGSRRVCRACGKAADKRHRSTPEYRARHAAYERERRAARA